MGFFFILVVYSIICPCILTLTVSYLGVKLLNGSYWFFVDTRLGPFIINSELIIEQRKPKFTFTCVKVLVSLSWIKGQRMCSSKPGFTGYNWDKHGFVRDKSIAFIGFIPCHMAKRLITVTSEPIWKPISKGIVFFATTGLMFTELNRIRRDPIQC